MRGYFDEEESESEPQPDLPRHDTELTFGLGALVGIVVCLVLICGVCFGIGYTLGKHSSARAAAPPVTQTPAPDQEPLQGSNSAPKPSASEQVPPTPPDTGDTATPPPTPDQGANPPSAQPSPEQPKQTAPPAAAPVSPAPAPARPAPQNQVRPAMPAYTPSPAPYQPSASTAPTQLTVQIAAVANSEDANVLVNALRRRNYIATARRDPADGLIHVRIGPFSSREEATRWRDRLLGDGYNAVIQP